MTYAADTLYEEVAYVAYHFHWSREEILDLEHAERREYVGRIAAAQHPRAAGVTRHVVAVALARRGAGPCRASRNRPDASRRRTA